MSSQNTELHELPKAVVMAAGKLFHEARERTPLWEVDTSTARKEGWLLNGLINSVPHQWRQALHETIAAFDADGMAVPLTDVVPEPVSVIPGGAKTGVLFRANHRVVFYASQPLWRSRYSKFRIAVDAEGHPYALKQLKSDRAVFAPEWDATAGESSLVVTPMSMIVREVSLSRFLGGHLVPAHVLRYGNEIFIVMPLMQDTLATLAADLSPSGKVAVARSVARQLAAQLLDCHHRDVAHTDVKLSNALWDREGRAILSDFGLATSLAGGLSQKRHRGTPRCSAPEVALGLPFTAKVDVWSLGILLTEFHVGDKNTNPFSAGPDEMPQHGPSPMHARWYFAATKHQAFAVWRRRLMRGDQLLFTELLVAVEEDNAFGKFFRPMVHQDPVLAAFVIGRMLDDSSHGRATMHDVATALGSLEPTGVQEPQWPTLPMRDPRRKNALEHLQQLAQRLR